MQALEQPARLGLAPEVAAAKHENQREAILDLLQKAGEAGVTTEYMAFNVGLRFGARIFELRRMGWEIETRARKGTEMARYVLKGKLEPGQIPLL